MRSSINITDFEHPSQARINDIALSIFNGWCDQPDGKDFGPVDGIPYLRKQFAIREEGIPSAHWSWVSEENKERAEAMARAVTEVLSDVIGRDPLYLRIEIAANPRGREDGMPEMHALLFSPLYGTPEELQSFLVENRRSFQRAIRDYAPAHRGQQSLF